MRIKYSLLPRLRNLTNKEMDFFLYVARHQDLKGYVPGVHNKDVCKHTGMCKQSFYTTLRSLETKQIIQIVYHSEIDYDIKIIGNDFSYPEAFKEGYVNLHRQVFHTQKFKTLKSNEKYLLFEFLKRTHEHSSSYQIGTKKFYDTFAKLLHVTERVIRYYLHSLRSFFSVGIKNGKYFITYMHSVFHVQEEKGVEQQEHEFFVEVQCRRNHIRPAGQIPDAAELIKQYRRPAGDAGMDIKQIMSQCIKKSVEQIRYKDRCLNTKYVHKLIRSVLFSQKPAFEA